MLCLGMFQRLKHWPFQFGLVGSGSESSSARSALCGGGRFGCCSWRRLPFIGRRCGFLSAVVVACSAIAVDWQIWIYGTVIAAGAARKSPVLLDWPAQWFIPGTTPSHA